MKKRFFALVLIPILFVTSLIYDAHTEDLHDVTILKQHLDAPQDFEKWYNQLNQDDKDLVLAGTVYTCHPDLTKTALVMGGNVNTQLLVINVTSGHNSDSSAYIYAHSSGDPDDTIMKAMADGMKRTSSAVKEESCGHSFAMMDSGTPGLMSLISVGISACNNTDATADMLNILKSNGLDINQTNELHVSSLSEAIEQKNINMVKMLLQNGADFSKTYAFSRMIEEYYSYEADENTEIMLDYVISYLKSHKLSPEAETDAYIKYRLKNDEKIKEKLEKLDWQPDYTTNAAKKRSFSCSRL